MGLTKNIYIVWVDPLSGLTLLWATVSGDTDSAEKQRILDECREQVRLLHGPDAAEKVRYR